VSIGIYTHLDAPVFSSSPMSAEYLYLTSTREVPIGIYTEHCGVDVGIYTEQYGETKYLYLQVKPSVNGISIYKQNRFQRWVFILIDIETVPDIVSTYKTKEESKTKQKQVKYLYLFTVGLNSAILKK